MSVLQVINPAPSKARTSVQIVLAFFAIYVLWGTTFLAIRIAVAEVPPLLAAGIRFSVAGAILSSVMRLRGTPMPSTTQWRGITIIAMLMFVGEYGPLFWAEKYVPSGLAAVLEATIPLVTIVLEVFIFRRQPFRWQLILALLLGFGGITVLIAPSGPTHVALLPCTAILVGVTSWSLGSILSQSVPTPSSRPMTAGTAMLVGGAVLLALAAASGELRSLPHIGLKPGLALVYLIVIGSLVGFTAFVWLLARLPATIVSSHAYVNPVVAVALGYFAAAEPVTPRTIEGTALVLVSVVLILRTGN